MTRELARIYETHGVDADLGRVLEAPNLIKEIWKTNTSPKERGRLTGKLYSEIGALLEQYPGQLDS